MKYDIRSKTPHMLAAAALALGLSASAIAKPPCDADGPRGPRGHGMHHRHPGFGHGPGIGLGHGFIFSQRLHDELKLDAKQEALWQEAQKFAKDSFDGQRERARKHHEEIAGLLNQPDADLRAIVKRMDELRAEGQKQRDAVRERWFSVYDALSPGQKEKVRLYLKDRAERPGPRFDKPGRGPDGKPGRGRNGRDERDGRGPRPPMEQAAPTPAQN